MVTFGSFPPRCTSTCIWHNTYSMMLARRVTDGWKNNVSIYKFQTPDHNLIHVSSISKSEFEAKFIIYISDHLFHIREICLYTKVCMLSLQEWISQFNIVSLATTQTSVVTKNVLSNEIFFLIENHNVIKFGLDVIFT